MGREKSGDSKYGHVFEELGKPTEFLFFLKLLRIASVAQDEKRKKKKVQKNGGGRQKAKEGIKCARNFIHIVSINFNFI